MLTTTLPQPAPDAASAAAGNQGADSDFAPSEGDEEDEEAAEESDPEFRLSEESEDWDDRWGASQRVCMRF